MKKVLLNKGLSYRGHGVYAVRGKEIIVEEQKAEELIKTGFFIETDTVKATNTGNVGSSEGNGNTKPIENMKTEELVALAEEKGINISSCKNNKERIEKIKGSLRLDNIENLFGE